VLPDLVIRMTDEPIDYDDDDLKHSGEEGGEHVDGGSEAPFFVSKQAAAVFKHKLLRVYFPKFAGKVGAYEADKRIVYVDTHAGRGAYDDGTFGSPLLVATNAAGMTKRRVDCVFIEKLPANHRHLRRMLAAHVGAEVSWQVLPGRASAHLDDALRIAGDSPLFMFIDPYGLGPTSDEVVRVLNRPRRGRGSKTEILLNFMSSAFGRAGGYLPKTTWAGAPSARPVRLSAARASRSRSDRRAPDRRPLRGRLPIA
jgi:three-Cys-motif partner protein